MLGTVTYAWITMTNKNFLDGLVVNISAGDKLEVSLDGITYYSTLPSDLFTDALAEIQMEDITSFDGETFRASRSGAAGAAIPNIDYASLTLWFRTDGAERNVYLVENVSDLVQYDIGMDGTYVVSMGMNWRSDETFVNGPNEIDDIVHVGDHNTYYASDAVRISFLEEQIPENLLDTRNADDLVQIIVDPSGDPLRGYGVPYGALSYANKKVVHPIQTPIEKPNVVNELTEFFPHNPYVAMNENSKIMELIEDGEHTDLTKTYYVGKVTLNIWLEGWDADCFDAILRDEIKVQLKFRAGKANTN